MKNASDLLIYETTTLKDALEVIDKGTMRIAIVVDKHKKFLGTLNDGDTRRAILSGYTLDQTIKKIYNCTPSTIAKNTEEKEKIIARAINNKVYQIPIVNEENKLVDVLDLATLLTTQKRKNRVVLMAGGLGTRLRPLTENMPKPLLQVGDKPILHTIVENFVSQGFENITISLNYKSDMIKDYFQDGSDFGANIEYIEEHKRLGTAGALSLLKDIPSEPFFVMNADLLTNIDFVKLLDFHSFSNADATMCVREYQYQIPYGVIQTNNEKITSIDEKPVNKFFVNAGIYLLSPSTLQHIPKDDFFDMPTLFENLIENNNNVLSFPIHEYWMDIGQHHDFIKANEEYFENFSKEDKQ
jgi:dTDP-glucose pyrophosphorylase